MKKLFFLLAIIGAASAAATAFKRDSAAKSKAKQATNTMANAVTKTAQQARSVVEDKVQPAAEKAIDTAEKATDDAADTVADATDEVADAAKDAVNN